MARLLEPMGRICDLLQATPSIEPPAHPAHVDVADGYCRFVVPEIPPRPVTERPIEAPPETQATLDIFGEGGPGDGGLTGSAARAAAAPGGALAAALAVGAAVLLRAFRGGAAAGARGRSSRRVRRAAR